jgi:beta-phosphoglucomutase-like phosphatase (HAD superfamily)
MLRPAWTPLTIGLMVLGFVVFWPLGLAMLAYIIWGDRLDEFKQDVRKATDGKIFGCRHSRRRHYHARTGNVAFDDWRDAELKRIEEERRKLDEARQEFDDYLRELRRAKDQEEFDRFMSQRRTSRDSYNDND